MAIRPAFESNKNVKHVNEEHSPSTTEDSSSTPPITSDSSASSPSSNEISEGPTINAPSSALSTPSQNDDSPNLGCSWENNDLPRWAIPETYRIILDLDMGTEKKISGSMEVDIDIQIETNCIILNTGKNIEVTNVEIKDDMEASTITHNEEFSQLSMEFPTSLKRSKKILKMDFNSELAQNDDLNLAKSISIYQEGATIPTIVTTFSESFGARSIFPCFDENNMLATFELSLTTPMDVVALANTQLLSTTTIAGRKTKYTFDTTPLVPTHMIGFASGGLIKTTKITRLREGQKDVRLWRTGGTINMANLVALEAMLQEFETRLNQAYTPAKLDYIALPLTPLGHGSLGLAYITESTLYAQGEMDSRSFLSITKNLAYKTAQIFFRHIVRLDNPLSAFLKDSLSSYFGYIGAEASVPGGGWFGRFYVENSWPSIAIDDGEGPEPLMSEDHSLYKSLIRNKKGASLIRMLRTYYLQGSDANERALTNDYFMNSLQDFMQEFKSSEATVEDLWKIMSTITGDAIDTHMQHWTNTPGVPIVHVIREGNDVFVKQSPLLTPKCDDDGAMWIPISFKTKAQPQPRWKVLQLCGPELLVTLESPEDSAIVNLEGMGYFRSHYHWDILDSWLSPTADGGNLLNPILDSLDLAIFLSDALGCNEVGKYKIAVFMDFVAALGARQDIAFPPWKIALDNLGKIRNLIRESDPTCTSKLSNYILATLTEPMLLTLNDFQVDDNDDMDLRLTRSTLLSAALDFGDNNRISEASLLGSSLDSVHPDLFEIVSRTIIYHGDEAQYEQIFQRGVQENEKSRQKALFMALFHTTNKDLLRRSWQYVIDGQYMDIQDVHKSVKSNKGAHMGNIFDVIIETYSDLKAKSGLVHLEHISELFLELSRSLTSETQAGLLKNLAEEHNELLAVAQEVLRIVSRNNEWLLKNKEPLCTWLNTI